MQTEQLKNGEFYHIYNRGIDGCDLFREEANYQQFLWLLDKYLSPVAEIYAWVLMPNHFHLLIRIKENIRYKFSGSKEFDDPVKFEEHKWETVEFFEGEHQVDQKIPLPHLHISHLMNAYSKYFNKRYERHGALFERAFKRKQILFDKYLKHVILYIHNNPVHHGFCSHPVEYPWSSYLTCVSIKPTKIKRDAVLGWFDSEANFKVLHNEKIDLERIERILDV